MSPPPDPPVDEPGSSHRGMIPREDLPFLPKIKWRFWVPVLAILVAFYRNRGSIAVEDVNVMKG